MSRSYIIKVLKTEIDKILSRREAIARRIQKKRKQKLALCSGEEASPPEEIG